MKGPVKERWKSLCEQAAIEQDPQKLLELVREINDLLREKQKRLNAERARYRGVAQIKESANKTSFWEQWVVRETAKGYEIAFGHHRLQAAIELYGRSYEVSVQLEDYSDEQMLVALADENTGDETSVEEQRDTVVMVRTYIKGNPAVCKLSHGGTASKTGEQHEHGSVR